MLFFSMGAAQPGEETAHWDVITVHKHLIGMSKEDSSVLPSDKVRANGAQTEMQEIALLAQVKHFFKKL